MSPRCSFRGYRWCSQRWRKRPLRGLIIQKCCFLGKNKRLPLQCISVVKIVTSHLHGQGIHSLTLNGCVRQVDLRLRLQTTYLMVASWRPVHPQVTRSSSSELQLLVLQRALTDRMVTTTLEFPSSPSRPPSSSALEVPLQAPFQLSLKAFEARL